MKSLWSKRVGDLPIRKKFMLSYVTIIIFTTFVISMAATLLTVNRLERKTDDMASQLAYYVATSIDYRLLEFEKQVNQVMISDAFQRLARRNTAAGKESQLVLDATSLGSLLSLSTLFDSHVLRIVPIMKNGAVFDWRKGNPKVSLTSIKDQEMQSMLQAVAVSEEERQSSQWRRGDDNSVVLIKRIVDRQNLNSLGFLICEVAFDYFQLKLSPEPLVLDPVIAIVDAKERQLAMGTTPELEQMVALLWQQPHTSDLRFQGQRYLVIREQTRQAQWQVLCFIPMGEMERETWLLTGLVLFACVICALCATVLAWRVASGTTRSIQRLGASMKLVEQGQLNVVHIPESRDEIGRLSSQFNQMVSQIRDLIDRVAEERLLRQAKEYEILQAQIDPHFLYNTLGSIRCMAQLNQQSEIENMIASLVEILRMALGSKGRNCRLSEELSCVENYLFLQKIRYEGSFSVEYDVQEETEDLFIVGFILQPIVENALYHGLEHSGHESLICIRASLSQEHLILQVQDNGVGMEEEMIRTILSGKRKPKKGFHSIGIRNVEERIQFYFGEEYGLSIQSRAGEGTMVEIRLPVVREGET